MTEEIVFKNAIKTSDAVSLVHRFVDHFLGKHEEKKFCAIVVAGQNGRVLAQAAMPDCSEHISHIALIQAKEAAKGNEVRCVDRKGSRFINGHFGSLIFPPKGFCIGFYVRHMSADQAASEIKNILTQID